MYFYSNLYLYNTVLSVLFRVNKDIIIILILCTFLYFTYLNELTEIVIIDKHIIGMKIYKGGGSILHLYDQINIISYNYM